MVHINKHQLFTLMFVFEVGSTTLFALGINAKQDAWIVILLALIIGMGFMWVYTELQSAFPDKNYVEIISLILGKRLAIPVILLNICGFLWHCARNLREFGEFMIITALPETPLWLISSIFAAVSVYVIFNGVEVLARISEILMPVILVFIIVIYILVYISGDVEFKRLAPVLGDGVMPIIKTVPSVVVFPFGELFVFLMYWNYSNEKNAVRKTTLAAVLLSGVLLCCSLIMDITVLGSKYTSIATVPFLEAIKLVNISEIIVNIDSIGIIIMFFGGFIKMTVYLFAIVLSLTTLFKIKDNRLIIILVSIFLIWFSLKFEPSYTYHQWLFPFDVHYFVITYTTIIPLLLLAIYWIKKKRLKL